MPLGGFTVDQLEEDLSDFNCKFDGDQEFVDKMNSLSTLLRLEADDLINETMAYATNLKREDLDVAFLDAFEAHYMKKKKVPASVSKSRAVLADLKPTTAGTPRRITKLDVSAMEMDDDPAEITMPMFDCANAPPHVTEFTMIASASGPGWFVNRTDSGKVVASHGGDTTRERKEGNNSPFNISVKQLAAAAKQSYGEPKAAVALDGMNARLEAYGEDVRAANASVMGDAPFTSLIRDGESEVFIIGFVGAFDGRDVSTIELERDEAQGAESVTVDVMALDERCFFPGQMAVFSGVNRTGSLFEASARLTAGKQPAAVVRTCDEDAVVWVAAGPFTPSTTAAYEPLAEIVQLARTRQPDVLVLIGPLVDRQSRFLVSKECTESDDDLTAGLLRRLAAKMKGSSTRVLFMPSSSREAAVVPVFPGATLREQWKEGVVEIISDPTTLVVGGAEIAITASDIVTHLSRAESHTSSNKENTDRMTRVAGHMLEQRCLYPLYPPSLAADIEGIHKACNLNGKQPHVIVAPALLAPFVKTAYGSVIANPGSTCKGASLGTLMKLRIGLSEIPEEGSSNLEKYTHVSISKI
ncbi:hypothetical protein PENTCL1PPCAC_10351 [Pristionchus entomophagus]|uniref:DNA polymerase alpha subunit B n=1 Tax=Pristionchus entomophagus TaxID=358040 RepID=A0AAV5T959_9BILA|nr:hypothetical protein PENTCL1PPCAC_10351 [Pristionchus entomophagus]